MVMPNLMMLPKISDSVEDLKNQLGRLSDKIDSQFVREQKDIKQMQKQMTVSLSVVMSLTVLSILITVFSWFSQRESNQLRKILVKESILSLLWTRSSKICSKI